MICLSSVVAEAVIHPPAKILMMITRGQVVRWRSCPVCAAVAASRLQRHFQCFVSTARQLCSTEVHMIKLPLLLYFAVNGIFSFRCIRIPSNTICLGSLKVYTPNRTLICSAVFAQCGHVTDRQTVWLTALWGHQSQQVVWCVLCIRCGVIVIFVTVTLACRCLASETDCDKLRERVSELRRKVDDTQAALLELGRENQSLQVLSTTVWW